MSDLERIKQNVAETKHKHEVTPYFAGAEKFIDNQWLAFIEPRLAGVDFSCIVELAPGHGRSSAKLALRAKEMYLVDVNEGCINACRERFGERTENCVMHYAVTDGVSLPGVPDGVVTFVYTWDSMVHFDTGVVEKYVHEFARVMKPGARGFMHHSNYGSLTDNKDSNWLTNPHWRSTTTKEEVARYCKAAELRVDRQDPITWGNTKDVDCITLFSKPA